MTSAKDACCVSLVYVSYHFQRVLKFAVFNYFHKGSYYCLYGFNVKMSYSQITEQGCENGMVSTNTHSP